MVAMRSVLVVVLLMGCSESRSLHDAASGPDTGRRDSGRDERDSGAFGGGDCFAAGTAIATPHGDVPIERLRVGDLVWSYDAARAQRSAAPVTQTFRHEDSNVRTLYLTSGDTLIVTDEHPFYLADNARYVLASELRVGAQLLTETGSVSVESWGARQHIDETFNIEVDGHHNYFAAGVLVHNKSDIPTPIIPCGDTLCTTSEICVIPCCETELQACEPPNEEGECPIGWRRTLCEDESEGCERPCEPPAEDGTCGLRQVLGTCADGSEGCIPDSCAEPYCVWGTDCRFRTCEPPTECISGELDDPNYTCTCRAPE